MDNLEHEHYLLSKMYLSAVGIWPYDKNTATVYLKRLFFTCTIITSATILSIGYIQHKTLCKRSISINTFLYGLMVTFITMKYCAYWKEIGNIRKILEVMRADWHLLINQEEQQIVLQHADRGRFINIVFSLVILCTMCSNVFLSLMNPPSTGACAATANIYIPMNYISNDKQIRYLLLLNIQSIVALGLCTILGTEVTSIIFVHHAIGLFQVIRYRMRNLFTDKTLCGSNTTMNKTLHERLANVARIHKRTLYFCKIVGETLGPMYFRVLLFGVVYTSSHLLHLADVQEQSDDWLFVAIEICVILVCFIYMFFANFMGQIIMDKSSKLLNEAYDTRWYVAPIPAQKSLLVIMQNCMKTYSFTIGGIFVPSYEGFATISRMSYSYFTIMRNVD